MSNALTQVEVERILPSYEGLVKETARRTVVSGVELDYEDICQLYRVKVWHAVQRFSEERAAAAEHLSHARDAKGRSPLDRFVFMCVTNMRKDIEKRPRRYNGSIDAFRSSECGPAAADSFDARYLSVREDEVYFDVVEESEPVLPSTLTEIERQVVMLRYYGRHLFEVDRELGLSRAQREAVMHSIREKLADWHPSPSPVRAPMRPLPGAEPRRRPAQRVLAV